MLAAIVTVRSLVIAALVVACATATVAFRPTRIEEVSIAVEIRFDADEVRVRERSIHDRVEQWRAAITYHGCTFTIGPAP